MPKWKIGCEGVERTSWEGAETRLLSFCEGEEGEEGAHVEVLALALDGFDDLALTSRRLRRQGASEVSFRRCERERALAPQRELAKTYESSMGNSRVDDGILVGEDFFDPPAFRKPVEIEGVSLKV